MSEHRFDRAERRGTRRVMLAAAVLAAVVLLAIVAWPLVPLITTSGSGPQSTNGEGRSEQRAGESGVAKQDTSSREDSTGERARAIKQTSAPLSLTQEQREKLRQIVGQQGASRSDQLAFDLEIGAAVPRQVELRDLPEEATRILNGYAGDQYVIVRDKLVIVDRQSRRIAAIVPDVA